MSAHTPGPWIYEIECGAHVIRGAEIEHVDKGTTFLFRDYVASTWGGENEADAALLAAAPELLAALREMIFGADAMGLDTEKARAAIAKAMGWDTMAHT